MRLSQELPVTTNRELPILPPETAPMRRIDPSELSDHTVVDPPNLDFDTTLQAERVEFGEALDDGRDNADAESPTQIEQRGHLPLPAPADTRVGRATLPGTKRRAAGQKSAQQHPRPPRLPQSRRPPLSPPPPTPPAKGKRDDQATAVSTDPLAPMQGPLIGGRYRVVQRVGQGGMGKVYKVMHAQLGKTFALKIINEDIDTEDGKARDLFYREARLASSLSHPNIASVVDFGEDEKHGAFMVMEFLDGEPLSKMLRRERRIGVKVALDLMMQVAEALHYIHDNKIVHCDIKTENILLIDVPGTKRRAKQLKLLDFGLARRTTASRNTNSLSGTPHYVAPERIRGEEATPSADIYALGILFYELVTGKVPWDGNVAQILCGHLELQATPPSELIEGGLDAAVETLILRALAKTPAERHPDMEAFIYELRTVMDMLGYGRRGRGAGGGKRVVVERHKNERDELVRAVFDGSRLPMALINNRGQIVVANPAFAKFVMGVAVDVEGLQVQATPLATAWTTFEKDLARAASGASVRRIVEVDVGPNEVRRLMIWLDPGAKEDQTYFGVHPLDD